MDSPEKKKQKLVQETAEAWQEGKFSSQPISAPTKKPPPTTKNYLRKTQHAQHAYHGASSTTTVAKQIVQPLPAKKHKQTTNQQMPETVPKFDPDSGALDFQQIQFELQPTVNQNQNMFLNEVATNVKSKVTKKIQSKLTSSREKLEQRITAQQFQTTVNQSQTISFVTNTKSNLAKQVQSELQKFGQRITTQQIQTHGTVQKRSNPDNLRRSSGICRSKNQDECGDLFAGVMEMQGVSEAQGGKKQLVGSSSYKAGASNPKKRARSSFVGGREAGDVVIQSSSVMEIGNVPIFSSAVQFDQGPEVINLVSEDEQEVEEDLGEIEIVSNDNKQKQNQDGDDDDEQQQQQIQRQQKFTRRLKDLEEEQVDSDEELQAVIREVTCTTRRKKHKSVVNSQEEDRMKEIISGIGRQMLAELGDNSVDFEVLKQALHATRHRYLQGSQWHDDWIAAAQEYMMSQAEQDEYIRRDTEAMRTAMAQSLREKKLVCNMDLQELFREFSEKSFMLKGIFANTVPEQVLLDIHTQEMTDNFRKMLELEKSCFKWYKYYEDTLKAYFNSLLMDKKLAAIHRKMSNLDQKSPRTQKKNKVTCEKDLCAILSKWHADLSNSILKYEQSEEKEDKQPRLPEVFHPFLSAQKQETIHIID